MSCWEIGFDRRAFRDYVRASNWYRNQSVRTAGRFIDAVDQTIERIRTNPLAGSIFRTRFRWMRVRKFPYIVYYQIRDEDRVVIMAVAHGQRRLGYWLRRASRA
jgi:plasmid stabilization system protein ParE